MENNQRISVIIRFHDESKIPLLDQALFSLATQSYPDVQVILAVQNGTPELANRLASLIEVQPFMNRRTEDCIAGKNAAIDCKSVFAHRILSIPVESGVDGRSILLNEAAHYAEGRYLAFLDYDDVVYHHAYALLIERITQSGAEVAVGGCRKAHQQVLENGQYFFEKKEAYLGSTRTKFDLIADNFIPIHSYVLDRAAIEAQDIHFNTDLFCLEDYAFLLGLVSKYRFDFELLLSPVAEYRWRTDGSNTVDVYSDSQAKNQQWDDARKYVARLRESLLLHVSAADIAALINETTKLRDKNYYLDTERAFYVKEFHYYKNAFDYQLAANDTLLVKIAIKLQLFFRQYSIIRKTANMLIQSLGFLRKLIPIK